MSHYKPYPAYKDSGVEWLGRVPEHWVACRFSRVIDGIKDGTHGTFERVDNGQPLLSAKNVGDGVLDISSSESQISENDHMSIVANGYPKRGDLLLTIVGSIGRACVYPYDNPLSFQRSVCFIRLAPERSPDFFRYFTQSKFFQEQIQSKSKSSAQAGIYMGDVSATSIAFPASMNEQQAIVTHLDRETARIDALVAKKTRFIELLREKRQALITHAVTKGLDPNVKMKDSGVEWLGEVPEHWEIKRLQFLCASIKAGPFGSALTKDMYVADGYRVYGQEQVIPGDFSIGDYYITPEYFSELVQYAVQPGDILVSCVGTFGKIAVVPEDVEPGIINPRLIRIRVNQLVSPAYLTMLMRSSVVFEQFSLWSRGGTMDVINIGTLSGIVLSVPPASEQQAILRYVEHEAKRIDALVNKTERSIDLLKERRSALITAAVTGQIDLREAV